MVTATAIAVSEIREEKTVRYMVESLKECLIDALFNADEELANEDDPFIADFLTGYPWSFVPSTKGRAALTTLALAFGLAVRSKPPLVERRPP